MGPDSDLCKGSRFLSPTQPLCWESVCVCVCMCMCVKEEEGGTCRCGN